MKNIKAAKELLEKYKSITLEQLEQKYKRFPGHKGKFIMGTFTDFGTIYCILCKSVNSVCLNCIYSFRKESKWHIPCIDIIYNEMCNATSAEELFNAIQKRIRYLTHVIEWYETMDKEHSSKSHQYN